MLSHTKFYKCVYISLFLDFFVWTVIGCLLLPLCHTAVIMVGFFFALIKKQYGWDDKLLEYYCPRLKYFSNIDASWEMAFCLYYNNDRKGSLNVSFISSPVLTTVSVLFLINYLNALSLFLPSPKQGWKQYLYPIQSLWLLN